MANCPNCPECLGSGWVEDEQEEVWECPACDGSGVKEEFMSDERPLEIDFAVHGMPPLKIELSLYQQAQIQAIRLQIPKLSREELESHLIAAVVLAETRQSVIRSLIGGEG